MKQPNGDLNQLLRTVDSGARFTVNDVRHEQAPPVQTRLADEDEAYLQKLLKSIRAGKRAIIIVEEPDEKLKYMFSNSERVDAIAMMGRVIEATAKRLGGETA